MAHWAPCGFDCEACPAYRAARAGDEKELARLAREYSTGAVRFEPEDMRCEGCRASSSNGSKLCAFCAVRDCALPRGVRVCAQCTSYPCARIEQAFPPGSPAREALDKMRPDAYNIAN